MLLVAVGLIPIGYGAEPAAADDAPSQHFRAVSPFRVLDTRNGTGGHTGAVGPGESIDVTVVGVGGVPVHDVSAVVLNVTSTGATEPSYVTVWPAGAERPNASALNTEPGQDTPNLVIATVGANGKVSIFHSSGSTHLVADITGWFHVDGEFQPKTPERVLDTRTGLGTLAGAGPIAGGQTIDLTVIPPGSTTPGYGTSKVVLNVTSTQATAPAYVTVWPSYYNRPDASSLNAEPGQDTPNLTVAEVDAQGRVSIYVSAGTMHLVVDHVGTIGAAESSFDTEGAFVATVAQRMYDSRNTSSLGPRSSVTVDVDHVFSPNEGFGAVMLNVTATGSTAPSYLTIWPTGEDRPTASSLNTEPGQDTPNLVISKVGPDGTVDIYNDSGLTDVVVDVIGWFRKAPAEPVAWWDKDQNLPIDDFSVYTNTPNPKANENVAAYYSGGTAGRLEVRSGATFSFAKEIITRASASAMFYARRADVDLNVDLDWEYTLTSIINLSASSQIHADIRVYELDGNLDRGPQIFETNVLSDGIGSGLKAAEVVNETGSLVQSYALPIEKGKYYDVVLTFECEVDIDVYVYSLVDCNGQTSSRKLDINSMGLTWDIGLCPEGDNRTGCNV